MGNEHKIHALNHLPERLQQRRIEVDVPPAIQQNGYAADLNKIARKPRVGRESANRAEARREGGAWG